MSSCGRLGSGCCRRGWSNGPRTGTFLHLAGLSPALDRDQVSNVDRAVQNAREFAGEVIITLKEGRIMTAERADLGFGAALDDLSDFQQPSASVAAPTAAKDETEKAAEAGRLHEPGTEAGCAGTAATSPPHRTKRPVQHQVAAGNGRRVLQRR